MYTLWLSVLLSVTPPKTDSGYICLSPKAYAFHNRVCHGLSRCTHGIKKVSKAEAIRRNYVACKICY